MDGNLKRILWFAFWGSLLSFLWIVTIQLKENSEDENFTHSQVTTKFIKFTHIPQN